MVGWAKTEGNERANGIGKEESRVAAAERRDPQWDDRVAHAASASATLREMEQEVQKRLAGLAARLVQDTAGASSSREWSGQAEQERPRCLHGGSVLVSRGKRKRTLQTAGGQQIELQRSSGTCPSCGGGFFPPR